MKRTLFLLFIIFFFACKSGLHHKVNARARELTDSAIFLWYKRDTVLSMQSILALDTVYYLKKIALLNKAINIDSAYFPAYLDKFDYQTNVKQYDSVIVTGNKILQFMPRLAAVRIRLGEIYDIKGDTSLAVKYYKASLSLLDKQLAGIQNNSIVYRDKLRDKAINLVLLGQIEKGKTIFKTLDSLAADDRERFLYQTDISKTKRDFLHNLSTMMP
jgi:tetratricopeptide (TPR) repeat protein